MSRNTKRSNYEPKRIRFTLVFNQTQHRFASCDFHLHRRMEFLEGHKMNPVKLLDEAVIAMQNCNHAESNTFVVGYMQNHIVCIPSRAASKLEIAFGQYQSTTIIHGLTAKQWAELTDRIANFYNQKGLSCTNTIQKLLPQPPQ